MRAIESLLVVSHRGRLGGRYGVDGVRRLEEALAGFRKAAEGSDLVTRVFFLDDSDHTGPLRAEDPGSFVKAVQALAHQVLPEGGGAILILGGDSIVPFFRFRNPVSDRAFDRDEEVLTDGPYGASDLSFEEALAPSRPVGRLCEDRVSGIESLLVALEHANSLRRSPTRSGTVAILDRSWYEASAAALGAAPQPCDLRLCPGFRLRREDTPALAGRVVYVNLHGIREDPSTWFAYDDLGQRFVPVLEADSIRAPGVTGNVFFCENCYGVPTTGSRSPSVALTAIREGARAFIGATGQAYGSFLRGGLSSLNGDRLAKKFFEALTPSTETGQALQEARRCYFDEITRSGTMRPYDEKTLLQFVLLGDPTL